MGLPLQLLVLLQRQHGPEHLGQAQGADAHLIKSSQRFSRIPDKIIEFPVTAYRNTAAQEEDWTEGVQTEIPGRGQVHRVQPGQFLWLQYRQRQGPVSVQWTSGICQVSLREHHRGLLGGRLHGRHRRLHHRYYQSKLDTFSIYFNNIFSNFS